MPLYEYLCKKCLESFTLTMTISEHDKKRIQCPVAKALNWSRNSSPFSRRHREKADDPLGRKGFHGHCFSTTCPCAVPSKYQFIFGD